MSKATYYPKALAAQLEFSGTLKLSLLNGDFVYDSDTEFFDTGDDDVSDPSNNIVNCTNYAHQAIAPTIHFVDATTIQVVLPDTSFGVLGGVTDDTVSSFLVWRDSGDPTTSEVLLWIPIENPRLTSGNEFIADFRSLAESGQFSFVLEAQS